MDSSEEKNCPQTPGFHTVSYENYGVWGQFIFFEFEYVSECALMIPDQLSATRFTTHLPERTMKNPMMHFRISSRLTIIYTVKIGSDVKLVRQNATGITHAQVNPLSNMKVMIVLPPLRSVK